MAEYLTLMDKRKYAAAERLLLECLNDDPTDDYVLSQLALVSWYRHKDEEALRYADRAKAVDPTAPLTLSIRAKILWSMEKFEQSITGWEQILNMSEQEVEQKGYGKNWAKSIINDARYYNALCLHKLFRDKEAFPLMEEHLKNRAKGLASDFTKQEATLFYKGLKYSDFRPYVSENDEGYATRPQAHRIEGRMKTLEEARQWDKLVRYLKGVCKRYPKEYYFHVRLSEYSKKVGNKADCLKYAEEAFAQETNDPLVKYTYAVALKYCGRNEDALAQFEGLVALGLDYIAYSEHGEGMRWAKKIVRHSQRYIEEIKQKEETAENH